MTDLSLKLIIKADGTAAVAGVEKVGQAVSGLDKKADTAGKSFDLLGTKASRAWDALGRQGQTQLAALRQTAEATDKATTGFGLMGRAVAGAFAVGAVVQFGSALIEAARKADTVRKTLEAVSGSSRSAAADYAAVSKTANTLGINLNAAASSYARLAASAKGTSLEGKATLAIFESVARAAATLGLSADETSGALLAIGQMMSKGSVQSEELRGQLGERLPGAFIIAARAMGVSTAELGKMLEKGEVLASDFLPKFAAELDKTFSASRFDGVANNVARITNAWDQFKASLAETVRLPAILKGVADAMQSSADSAAFNRASDLIGQKLRGAAVKITSEEAATLREAITRREAWYTTQGAKDMAEAVAKRRREFEAVIVAATERREGAGRLGSSANIGTGGASSAMAAQVGRNTELLKKSAEERAKYERESAISAAREKKDVAELTKLYTEKLVATGKMTQADAAAVAHMQALDDVQKKGAASANAGAKALERRNAAVQQVIANLQDEIRVLGLADTERAVETELRSKGAKATAEQRDQIRGLIEQKTELAAQLAAETQAQEMNTRALQSLAELRDRLDDAKRLADLAEELRLQGLTTQQIDQRIEKERKLLEIRRQFPGNIQGQAAELAGQLTDQENRLGDLTGKGVSSVKDEVLRMNQAFQDGVNQAREFATTMKESFGSVGEAIGGVSVALAEYGQTQWQIQRDMAQGLIDQQTGQLKLARAQVKSMGDMTEAAAGFFKKGTTGYNALTVAAKVFRAAELAAQVKPAFEWIGEALKGLFGLGQQAAVTGVANQATQGDPYSAIPRMAAMAAIMAGLGFAVSGIGGDSGSSVSAQDRQEALGTGTVLGDAKAKSNSIAESLELMAENSNINLNYSAGMLASLRNIESKMLGLAKTVIAGVGPSSGIRLGTTGQYPGFSQTIDKIAGFIIGIPFADKIMEPIAKMLFKVSVKIKDWGIQSLPQTLGDIIKKGFEGLTYTDVEIKKSLFGMMTLSKKTKTFFNELDASVAKGFTKTILAVADGIRKVSDVFGIRASVLNRKLLSFVVDFGKISLKDLDGKAVQDALNAAFSAMTDRMAARIIPGLGAFQKIGEGYAKTTYRVAKGIATAEGELNRINVASIKYTDVLNKQGDVYAEIARQSIVAAESAGSLVSGIGLFIREADGTGADIIQVYKDLVAIRNIMRGTGIDSDHLSRTMTEGAGGVDQMLGAMKDFHEGFFTATERYISDQRVLGEEFAALGIVMPKTKDDFRKLVQGIDTATEAGQELFGRVISLSQSFLDLQEAQAAAQASVDDAKSRLKDAYDREQSAMQKVIDKMTSLAKSLRDFIKGLQFSSESILSPEQKYQAARTEFLSTRTKAAAGDQTALDALQSVTQTFLTQSRDYFGANASYAADFRLANTALEQVAVYAEGRASASQAAMDLQKEQVSKLIDINESVLSVADAIQALAAATAASSGANATVASQVTQQQAAAEQKAKQIAAENVQYDADKAAFEHYGSELTRIQGEIAASYGKKGQEQYHWARVRELDQLLAYLRTSPNFILRQHRGGNTATPADDKWGLQFKARAVGGWTSGPTLVGEQGPEIVDFRSPALIRSHSQTRNDLQAGNDALAKKQDQQIAELKALVRLQQAANQALLDQLQAMNDKLGGIERKTRLGGAKAA
jgi:tape measure domain-containing protein